MFLPKPSHSTQPTVLFIENVSKIVPLHLRTCPAHPHIMTSDARCFVFTTCRTIKYVKQNVTTQTTFVKSVAGNNTLHSQLVMSY